jgi:hypothetical protein
MTGAKRRILSGSRSSALSWWSFSIWETFFDRGIQQRLANKQERLFEVIRMTTAVIYQIRETFPRPWDDGDRGLEVRAAEIPVPQASRNLSVFVSFGCVFVMTFQRTRDECGCYRTHLLDVLLGTDAIDVVSESTEKELEQG